jgi:hypothetical protein
MVDACPPVAGAVDTEDAGEGTARVACDAATLPPTIMDRDAALFGRDACTAYPGETKAGALARDISASIAAGRGVLLINTARVAGSADERAAGAATSGRKTAMLAPALLAPADSGEVVSLMANFGTGAFVATAICSAVTPMLMILPPAKE